MRIVLAALLSLPTVLSAQTHGGHGGHQPADVLQPYAGYKDRAVKALSAEEIADLRSGRGMGFALAAELNGYPGPVHVIENADALGLSGDQRMQVSALKDARMRESVAAGEALIAAEAVLDALFAGGAADPAAIQTAVLGAGVARAQVRATHLRYHLTTRDLLTEKHVGTYAQLRGYTKPAP